MFSIHRICDMIYDIFQKFGRRKENQNLNIIIILFVKSTRTNDFNDDPKEEKKYWEKEKKVLADSLKINQKIIWHLSISSTRFLIHNCFLSSFILIHLIFLLRTKCFLLHTIFMQKKEFFSYHHLQIIKNLHFLSLIIMWHEIEKFEKR